MIYTISQRCKTTQLSGEESGTSGRVFGIGGEPARLRSQIHGKPARLRSQIHHILFADFPPQIQNLSRARNTMNVAAPFSPLPEGRRKATHHNQSEDLSQNDDSDYESPAHTPNLSVTKTTLDGYNTPEERTRSNSSPSPPSITAPDDDDVFEGNPFELPEMREQPKGTSSNPPPTTTTNTNTPTTTTTVDVTTAIRNQARSVESPSRSTVADASSSSQVDKSNYTLPSEESLDQDPTIFRGFSSIELESTGIGAKKSKNNNNTTTSAQQTSNLSKTGTDKGAATRTVATSASTSSLPGLSVMAAHRAGLRKPVISRGKVQMWHNMVLYLSAIVFCEIFLIVGLTSSGFLALLGLELVVLGIAPTFVLVDSSDNGFLSRHTVARSMEHGHCGLTPGIWKWDIFAIPLGLVSLFTLVLAPQLLALSYFTDFDSVLRWRLFLANTVMHAVVDVLMLERRRADKALARRHEEASFSLSV